MRVRALVFDFDGLLLETEEALYESWRDLFETHGIDLTLGEWGQSIGTADTIDPMDELERRTGRQLDREWLQATRRARRDELLDGVVPSEGVMETIEAAASLGLPMAVASSSPLSWVDSHLARLGIRAEFQHLSCYDGTCSPKPAPDLYLAAVALLGVEPRGALAFEDSQNGVLAAKSAGLTCVAVPTVMTKHMDFALADFVLERLGEPPLAELIEAIEAS